MTKEYRCRDCDKNFTIDDYEPAVCCPWGGHDDIELVEPQDTKEVILNEDGSLPKITNPTKINIEKLIENASKLREVFEPIPEDWEKEFYRLFVALKEREDDLGYTGIDIEDVPRAIDFIKSIRQKDREDSKKEIINLKKQMIGDIKLTFRLGNALERVRGIEQAERGINWDIKNLINKYK